MKLRRLFARFVAAIVLVAVSVFASVLLGVFPGKTIPVLMYHHVVAGDKLEAMKVTPENFQLQMNYLKQHHYRVIGPDEVVAAKKNHRSPYKNVMITLDDGFEDNYTSALPILESCGFKAMFFIVADWVGKPGFMSWDQILELERRGHIIGSHTVTHPMLTEIGLQKAKHEIYNSKQWIETALGIPVHFFCYPTGRFNESLEEMVRQAGYDAAFVTAPGRAHSNSDVFALKRIRVSDSSDAGWKFWWRVAGYYLLAREHKANRMQDALGCRANQ